jgi:hypothetical protein
MSSRTFVLGLLNAVPEVKPLVTAHLTAGYGEVQLHLLVSDVRHCIDPRDGPQPVSHAPLPRGLHSRFGRPGDRLSGLPWPRVRAASRRAMQIALSPRHGLAAESASPPSESAP